MRLPSRFVITARRQTFSDGILKAYIDSSDTIWGKDSNEADCGSHIPRTPFHKTWPEDEAYFTHSATWNSSPPKSTTQMAEYPLWRSTSELPVGVTRTGRTPSTRRAYRPSAALTTTPGNFRPWS